MNEAKLLNLLEENQYKITSENVDDIDQVINALNKYNYLFDEMPIYGLERKILLVQPKLVNINI